MGILNSNNCIMLIIDVQEKLLNAVFNRDLVAQRAEVMAKAANILNVPIIITEQYPQGLGKTIESIKSSIDNNKVFEKTSFSALDNEDVFDAIKSQDKTDVILFGIETHICVSQTANALIELGYEVSVISDACGSRDEAEYLAGLSRMKENGAHIITAEIALFEWLRSSKHPNFKEIQRLIK